MKPKSDTTKQPQQTLPTSTEYVEPLGFPEKLEVETYGQDSVCIFAAPQKSGNRSLLRQPHFDSEERPKNEAICNELVRRYNLYSELAKALQDIINKIEINPMTADIAHYKPELKNAKQVLKQAGLTE